MHVHLRAYFGFLKNEYCPEETQFVKIYPTTNGYFPLSVASLGIDITPWSPSVVQIKQTL